MEENNIEDKLNLKRFYEAMRLVEKYPVELQPNPEHREYEDGTVLKRKIFDDGTLEGLKCDSSANPWFAGPASQCSVRPSGRYN